MKNQNAIFFAISDSYSFAVANVMIGLKKHSKHLLDKSDVLIFHNGLTENNKVLLEKIHRATYFFEMQFPEKFDVILNHKVTKKWGEYVVAKLFGFDLVKQYEKVLFLDADLLIKGDISAIFDIKNDIAWRKVKAWNPKENFATLLSDKDDYISACNAGVIFFNSSLNRFNLTSKDLLEAFDKVKDLKRGGIEERILAYIVYRNHINLTELDIDFNSPVPDSKGRKDVKIIHFLDFRGISTKPWKNLASYLYFEEWTQNYEDWILLGGKGLVDFNKSDYYELFSFDLKKQIIELRKSNKDKDEIILILKEKIVENKFSNFLRRIFKKL